nr:hypothetical protein [Tanacetum cinerariifolium]
RPLPSPTRRKKSVVVAYTQNEVNLKSSLAVQCGNLKKQFIMLIDVIKFKLLAAGLAVNWVKAYVVFESEDSAQASLAHNMAVKGPVKPKAALVESKVGKTKILVEDKELKDEHNSDVEGSDGEVILIKSI